MKSGAIYLTPQRTPEWYALRCGKVTASRIGDLMATTRNGWGAPRKNYLREIVAERLTGRPVIKRVPSMDARSDMEPEARLAYEFYKGAEVDEIGFVEHPSISNAGASPDGFVGKDGGIEIKCLNTENHIELLKAGEIDAGYLLQVQFGMACSGRQWTDFVSYDPRLPEDLKVFLKRISRDEGLIERIEKCVEDFLAEIDAEVQKVCKQSSI